MSDFIQNKTISQPTDTDIIVDGEHELNDQKQDFT